MFEQVLSDPLGLPSPDPTEDRFVSSTVVPGILAVYWPILDSQKGQVTFLQLLSPHFENPSLFKEALSTLPD